MLGPLAWRRYAADLAGIVRDFDRLPLRTEDRHTRIGVVGEILVKFHPDANGHIVETIEAEGAEALVPELYDFFIYSGYGGVFRHRKLDGSLKDELRSRIAASFLELRRRYPAVPIAPIDFDPGASEVNQLNRLKLLVESARRGQAAQGRGT